MNTVKNGNTIVELSWKNVLLNHSHNIRHVSDMAQTAFLLGYGFMLWNGRIYSVFVDPENSTDYIINDTGFLESDIS